MYPTPTATAVLAALLGAIWLLLRLRRRRSGPKLPPGPWGLPIIGNLHMIGSLPHRSLRKLSEKYGPIMSMRLGQVPTIVVSSPESAELFLKTHDTVFASRPKTETAKYFHYGIKGMILTEYGPYWRNVRRLSTVKLLNATKIESFEGRRKMEVESMVESIKESAAAREVVDVSSKVGETIENMVCQMVIGRGRDDRFKLKETFQAGTQLAGAFNIGEFVPYLLPLDLQGISRGLKEASKNYDKVLDLIIDEHIREAENSPDKRQKHSDDFIDVLLALINTSITDPNDSKGAPTIMERPNIKAILTDMLGAAMDTSASSVEWAVSELFRNPSIMKKLQEEIRSVVGPTRMVMEDDLPKLTYLDMVVKESMRLHPAVALLLPHESMEDITINGYHIPKKSRIIVNTWAIQRDPNAWPESPEEFIPERFSNSKVDVVGRDFQLIPFGSGRRGCAGIRLGLIFVKLVLSQIVHCFDWELDGKVKPNELDMDEKFGLATHRAHHLLAVPTYRLDR